MATLPFAPTPVVLHACYAGVSRQIEFFVSEHVLMHVLSGSFVIFTAGAEQTYRVGDTILLTRHQLLKATKHPESGGEYSSVSIVLDQATLRELHYLASGPIVRPPVPVPVVALPRQPLFGVLAQSIIAYNAGRAIPQLPPLKAQKALVLLLLHVQLELRHVLFDFSEPGKPDLGRYMAQCFRFSLEMKQFSCLTGRCLATFKHDFKQLFHLSPSRWLR